MTVTTSTTTVYTRAQRFSSYRCQFSSSCFPLAPECIKLMLSSFRTAHQPTISSMLLCVVCLLMLISIFPRLLLCAALRFYKIRFVIHQAPFIFLTNRRDARPNLELNPTRKNGGNSFDFDNTKGSGRICLGLSSNPVFVLFKKESGRNFCQCGIKKNISPPSGGK